jgi:hypothetical protein
MPAGTMYMLVAVVSGVEICLNYGIKLFKIKINIEIKIIVLLLLFRSLVLWYFVVVCVWFSVDVRYVWSSLVDGCLLVCLTIARLIRLLCR